MMITHQLRTNVSFETEEVLRSWLGGSGDVSNISGVVRILSTAIVAEGRRLEERRGSKGTSNVSVDFSSCTHSSSDMY